MRQITPGRAPSQRHRARRQFLEEPQLGLGRLLPPETVAAALERHGVTYRKRLYTPLVTLWLFLGQVLAADSCCRAAVARLLACVSLGAGGQCGFGTGAYCKARARLPEPLLADLARDRAAQLHTRAPKGPWLGGRPIKIVDGTTVSMPDTPANQKVYPQAPTQAPGLGFPILRLVGIFGLSSGAWLDLALGPYAGKQSGETALLRKLLGCLDAGDVLLGDACFANYWMIALLGERGVDLVSHHDGKRRVDFRTGRRLGRGDHVVTWHRPVRPPWMPPPQYDGLPQTLAIREVHVAVAQRGFRTRHLLVTTTLLDPQVYSAADLAAAYRARWHAELDLRTLKQVLRMDVLRCQSPTMVRKEIWMHVLAYNLVRTLMAQAAALAHLRPRELSFTGTLQALVAFAAAEWACPPARRAACYQTILRAVAVHRVADRPDRVEPRALKRRPKEHALLTEPRAAARKRLLAGG
jgi:hypothetical protein